jgi:topoisomerase-4 subunit B
MYTDTTRPNHLAQEVIDNSVDEALAGHATRIDVTLFADGSCEVSRRRPRHAGGHASAAGLPGVEVILTKLHAGGKFSAGSYRFSGGLHGVGVSVVNALSKHLEVWVKRGGKEYNMAFAGGDKLRPEEVGTVGRNTGTRLHFWPDPKYFDSPKFAVRQLTHLLRAKAVLCPGLTVRFRDEASGDEQVWCYEDGLKDYLQQALDGLPSVPEPPFVGSMESDNEAASLGRHLAAGGRRPGHRELRQPDPDRAGRYPRQRPAHRADRGGARVLRVPQPAAARRQAGAGGRLGAGQLDLSVKLVRSAVLRPDQGALSSRECAAFVSGVVKDAFSLWLNQHVADAERIAELAIGAAQARLRAGRKVTRKKVTQGPALPGKLADCTSTDPSAASCSWWRATPPVAPPSRPATGSSRPSCRCGARS